MILNFKMLTVSWSKILIDPYDKVFVRMVKILRLSRCKRMNVISMSQSLLQSGESNSAEFISKKLVLPFKSFLQKSARNKRFLPKCHLVFIFEMTVVMTLGRLDQICTGVCPQKSYLPCSRIFRSK